MQYSTIQYSTVQSSMLCSVILAVLAVFALTPCISLQPTNDTPESRTFAKTRLQLGESLYYKTLENIMLGEKKRLCSKDPKYDFTVSTCY